MDTYQKFSARRASLNAALLMFRSVITIIIGLITSRIIFNALGVENYGINAVVGGLLPAFTFIGGILAAATSRFLTFEIGKGDENSIKETFTATYWAHLGLAIILVIVCEIGGIYLLHHKLDIPAGREHAAMVVLQCSIIGVFFGTTQVPFGAMLVAREQFKVYAYVSLVGAFYGLISAFIVKYAATDKLILYVVLGLFNSIASTLFLRYYCRRHYSEAHLERKIKFSRLRPILVYTSWELFGNFCGMLYNQSRNYLVNIFFGVTYNSSTSVATTVSGSINAFTYPISSAFAPSVTKQYAQNNFSEMQRAMKSTMRFSLMTFALFAVPIWFNAETLFQLWLGSVPTAAPAVLRCILLTTFSGLMAQPINHAIHAIGKVQWVSIIGGLYVAAQFFIIYWCYSAYHNYLHAFIVMAIGAFFEIFQRAAILKKQQPRIALLPLFKTMIRISLVVAAASVASYLLGLVMEVGFIYMVVSSFMHLAILAALAYIFVFNHHERGIALNFVQSIPKRLSNALNKIKA